MSFAGPTVSAKPVIQAWQSTYNDVKLHAVDILGDGRVVVGIRTVPGNGGFHTEVAIENLNSHQSIKSLEIGFCGGEVSNAGFKDVDYHAEDFSDADWMATINGSVIEWSTETFEANENANALRWGTLYSYWCDSEREPAFLNLGLFRPGEVTEVSVEIELPEI
ncbi:MAG: hypothetical protein AAGA30_17175, partial [Planctomycetota bacterium]